MIELMALADGELDGDARARAEALVASNEEARALVGELRRGRVGSWLRESFERRADTTGADGIVAGVMTRIGAVPSAVERPQKGTSSAARPPTGSPVRVSTQTRRVARGRWAALGAAVLAAAAAFVLYLRRLPPAEMANAPRAPLHSAEVASESPAEALGSGVEVDEIEAPARGVSVFEIPVGEATAAAGGGPRASSVVVWIDDPPGAR
jgi:hypothetical protein